jgi:hypothetical protein
VSTTLAAGAVLTAFALGGLLLSVLSTGVGNGAIRVFSATGLAIGLGCVLFGVTGRRFFYHYRSPHAPPADMDPRQAHESHEPRP